MDTATSNDDLLLDTIANDGVAPAPGTPSVDPELLRIDGPTLAEYVAAGYPAETYPPQGYADLEPIPVEPDEPVDQHAESGYRPVTGQEIQDYVRAKSLGLEGRPSKGDVAAFLQSRGG